MLTLQNYVGNVQRNLCRSSLSSALLQMANLQGGAVGVTQKEGGERAAAPSRLVRVQRDGRQKLVEGGETGNVLLTFAVVMGVVVRIAPLQRVRSQDIGHVVLEIDHDVVRPVVSISAPRRELAVVEGNLSEVRIAVRHVDHADFVFPPAPLLRLILGGGPMVFAPVV